MAYKDPDYMKKYREANREKLRAYDKTFHEKNKEKRNTYRRDLYLNNREYEVARVAKYQRERSENDPSFRLARVLRNRIGMALKQDSKAGSAVRDLGCSVEEFRSYIENQFKEGMSWDNHGEWHLDHIKPLALFDLTDRSQFLEACHYTNYQPLWATENLSKGAKYELR